MANNKNLHFQVEDMNFFQQIHCTALVHLCKLQEAQTLLTDEDLWLDSMNKNMQA